MIFTDEVEEVEQLLELFSPLNIKNLRSPNRIVLPPMTNRAADEKGHVTQQIVDHYVARASVGLIIVESSYINRSGCKTDHHLGIYDDDCLPGLAKLAQAIHEAGTVCGIQINHFGSSCKREITGEQPVGPSAVSHPKDGGLPRELTCPEIPKLVEDFVLAARRAKRAGFDMVEIHGANGYLLNQFLSPFTNRRHDEYGGPLANRLRFALEVLHAVRQEVGSAYPIFYRLGPDDDMEGGLTLEEGARAAVLLAEAGVDVLDLSGGLKGSRAKSGEGYYIYLAEKIKPLVKVPVLVTGGVTIPNTAEKIISDGIADIVGIGRALLANANWVVEAGKILQ